MIHAIAIIGCKYLAPILVAFLMALIPVAFDRIPAGKD